MTLWQRLLRYLEPPVPADEARRQARVIVPVYWVGFALSASVGTLQMLQASQRQQALPTFVTLATMALCWPLMRAHRERLAGILILLSSTAINAYTVLTQGGMFSPATRTYEVLVLAAGLILGARLVVPITLAGLLTMGAALWGQAQGWIVAPASLEAAQTVFLTAVGLLLASSVIVYFAAQALRQRADFNEGVVQSLPGLVTVYDLDQRRHSWSSREVFKDLGWERAELGSNPVATLLHPEDRAQLPAWQARWQGASDGQVQRTDFRLARKDGSWRHWEARETVFLRHPDGRPAQLIGYYEDVTEKHAAAESLSRAERLHSLGQLAGGVAHDFNNVLAPIMGNAELLKQGLQPSDERWQAAEAIRRNADRARELTRTMLNLSSAPSIERHVLDLNQVIEGFLKLLRRSLRHDLVLEFLPCPGPLPIVGDGSQLERTVLNLALNAQDALPGQGRIHLSTRIHEGRAELFFSDNGPGMSAEVKARAFEPFFTTKEPGQGTGLGLSTVHAMVLQHQGRISVESEPGQGCRFTLSFPLAAPAAGAARLPWPGTVLLVDDEEDLRVVLSRLLQSLGWRVLQAATGDSALAVAASEPGPISLLVSDIRLPGLRGPEVARQLEAQRPGLRTIFISGFSEEEDLRAPLLAKPFELDHLKTLLKELQPQG